MKKNHKKDKWREYIYLHCGFASAAKPSRNERTHHRQGLFVIQVNKDSDYCPEGLARVCPPSALPPSTMKERDAKRAHGSASWPVWGPKVWPTVWARLGRVHTGRQPQGRRLMFI
jgi:hypothetical protein